MDLTRTLETLIPTPDGESPVRHRTGVVTAVSGSVATVDLGGALVDASILAGAAVGVGQVVQVLVWAGDLLVLGAAGGAGVELIGSVVASGSSSTMSITNIPQTHTDLLIIIHGSHPAASGQQFRTVTLRFNGDAGANYRWVKLDLADGGAPVSTSGIGVSGIQVGGYGDDVDLSMTRAEVPDYSVATNHPVTFQTGASFGSGAGASQANYGWGSHISAAAITQVTAVMTTENWRAGSDMRVYGIG